MEKKVLAAISFILLITTIILASTFIANYLSAKSGEGTCCPQLKSVCIIDGVRVDDHYDNGIGPCH
ncbi:MAG: hypothetical protein C0168_03560 [Candidatus Aminicenantes bacterium]|nr:MAG: hypothetical protein C0168_03560 [Candidatus Aminicenantes bacterium]